MPVGNVRVTPEQLQAISGQLNSGAGEIESIISQLMGQASVRYADTDHEIGASFQV